MMSIDNGQHEAQVIPVLVRPCDWHSAPFADLQVLPENARAVTEWQNPDQAWTNIARGLRSIIENRLGGSNVEPPKSRAARRNNEPSYADDASRELSQKLRELYRHRKILKISGDDVTEIQTQILDLRRLLRRGPQLQAGEFLGDGRYQLLEVVGQGGFATVWKAWDTEADQLVAIKVLHGHLAGDRSRRERLFRGARQMAQLSHQHIVRVWGSELREGGEDGWFFFAMEYVAGGNLERAVLENTLTGDQRLEIIRQVAQALDMAHRQGVVHRDVKPSNILIDSDQQAKLTDFDLVRADDTTGMTATQAMMGTIQFAAPEALEVAKEAGPETDIYSLGSTAVFALRGARLPSWYYRQPQRAIDELRCPTALRETLSKATALDAKGRFESAGDFAAELSKTKTQARKRRRSLAHVLVIVLGIALSIHLGILAFDARTTKKLDPTGDLTERTGLTERPDPPIECTRQRLLKYCLDWYRKQRDTASFEQLIALKETASQPFNRYVYDPFNTEFPDRGWADLARELELEIVSEAETHQLLIQQYATLKSAELRSRPEKVLESLEEVRQQIQIDSSVYHEEVAELKFFLGYNRATAALAREDWKMTAAAAQAALALDNSRIPEPDMSFLTSAQGAAECIAYAQETSDRNRTEMWEAVLAILQDTVLAILEKRRLPRENYYDFLNQASYYLFNKNSSCQAELWALFGYHRLNQREIPSAIDNYANAFGALSSTDELEPHTQQLCNRLPTEIPAICCDSSWSSWVGGQSCRQILGECGFVCVDSRIEDSFGGVPCIDGELSCARRCTDKRGREYCCVWTCSS